jgi:bifunctional non-homologous end joining protein LigD
MRAQDLRPMLATLPARDPSLEDPRLVYEPKYDGIRALVLVEPGPRPVVRFWSRNGNEKTAQFPEIAEALTRWATTVDAPVILDGEIVALHPDGRPAGFQRLQGRINVSVPGYRSRAEKRTPEEQPAAFIAFDLLQDGGRDLCREPLTARRAALERRFSTTGSDLLRLSEQVAGDGRALRERAEREGWEGLLAKLASSPYRAGKRSAEWLKVKLQQQEEFVVGGWTEPKGTRTRFGALVLGVPVSTSPLILRYVGDVGTGFTGDELERLWKQIAPLAVDEPPFETRPKTLGRAHWVKPQLVVQVRYTEMTDEGRLRHPAYLGQRTDKTARQVAQDRPKAPALAAKAPTPRKAAKVAKVAPAAKIVKAPRPTRRRGRAADPLAAWQPECDAILAQLDDLEQRRKDGVLRLPGDESVDVTNLHKVFWPAIGRTKGDLLRYYTRVAPVLLPVIADRPLVMKRLPNGVAAPSFYQHRAPDKPPAGVRQVTIPDDDVPSRLVGGGLKTLLYMAQLASISMDPWFSRVDALHTPDQVAIDLDPGEGTSFDKVLDVARWVHEVIEMLHVPAFPKTSGSEGLHIFIPLAAGTPYEAGMLFCQIVATMVAAQHPKVATVERSVKKRPRGTVYVDYLQNIEGKTLACAYSARASAFAGASAPLTWREVHDGVKPDDFTIDTLPARIRQVGDLWAPLREVEPPDLLEAVAKLRG